MSNRRWFVEASASYAAAHLTTNGAWIENSLKNSYLRVPVGTVEGNPVAYACYALVKIARCPACDGRVWCQAACHAYLAPHRAVTPIAIPTTCPPCAEEIFPDNILK